MSKITLVTFLALGLFAVSASAATLSTKHTSLGTKARPNVTQSAKGSCAKACKKAAVCSPEGCPVKCCK